MTENSSSISLAALRKKIYGILSANRAKPTAWFEADYIISELSGISRNEIVLAPGRDMSAVCDAALAAAARRLHNEPLQYIFGRAYFMNLELFVSPDVLIPRPETELLVEWIVKNAPCGATLLDIGCGSGAIPLAVAEMRTDMQITGVDISDKALAVARKNRELCNLPSVNLLYSDIFSGVPGRQYNIISANLPYIAPEELAVCPEEVRCFEPHLALVAGDGGTALIKRTLEEAGNFLCRGGRIIMEIGETQGERVGELMRMNCFQQIELHLDYNSRPRFISGQWTGMAD